MTAATAESATVAGLLRALEEAHSRHAGVDEETRVEGIARALEQALASMPEAGRPALLDALEETVAEPLQVQAPAPAGQDDEVEELREEVLRLRAALAAAEENRPRPAGPAASGIAEALLGGSAEASGVDGQRAAVIVRTLTAFATDLVRALLAAPEKKGDSVIQVDRFRTAMRGELKGTQPTGATEKLLEEAKGRIALQFQAFTVACDRGGRSLLSELDPAVLEDLAGSGFGLFKYQRMWEAFVLRHRDLKDADLFDTYFDGALRAALNDLRERK